MPTKKHSHLATVLGCMTVLSLTACQAPSSAGAASQEGTTANSGGTTSTGTQGPSTQPNPNPSTSTSTGDASSTDASSGGPTSEGTTTGPANPGAINHSLGFLDQSKTYQIYTQKKSFNEQSYHSFVDGLDREVHFRGWNTSGSVKLMETGFKPFKSQAHAKESFARLRGQAGSNIARFTLAWEGVHTGPDQIDTEYLDQLIAQMREAISRKVYVFLDYHSDLYSRYTFTKDSKNTGNGAPRWVVKGGNHGIDTCGVPCDVSWSAHKLSDKAVRSAMRDFWKNAPIVTHKGERYVQTEFLWQVNQTAAYVKSKLSPEEFAFVLGIEPFNEPFDGGIKELGIKDYKAFDNELLWPFYQRVRKAISDAGWQRKWVFAEPMVFWSSQAGVVAPATGGGHLDAPPGPGFVFSPHFYDQGRQGVANLKVARNGAYIGDIDKIRDEAKFLDLPVLVTEFGMWVEGHGHTDTQRIVNSVYQSLESSDRSRKKDRFLDFFTPMVGATQWHWDIYYDNHKEYQNQNPEKLLTKYDAWNKEKYSVINDFGKKYNVGQHLVERAYPRRVQGQLLQFAYHARVKDVEDERLDWHGIRVSDDKEAPVYFQNKKFFYATWMGGDSSAPTEFFLPRHIDPSKLTVITRDQILAQDAVNQSGTPKHTKNEILVTTDPSQASSHGHRLFAWDDRDSAQKEQAPNFILVVQDNELKDAELQALQKGILSMVQAGRSPVYMTGRMTEGGYPEK